MEHAPTQQCKFLPPFSPYQGVTFNGRGWCESFAQRMALCKPGLNNANQSTSTQGHGRAGCIVVDIADVPTAHHFLSRHKSGLPKPALVHILPAVISQIDCCAIIEDANKVANKKNWTDRGAKLPTDDVLVKDLTPANRRAIKNAFRQRLMPYVKAQFPQLNVGSESILPTDNNLFVIRYDASMPRRHGLALHQDSTALTVNVSLSNPADYKGGGTFFPAAELAQQGEGLVVRNSSGGCLVHDGDIPHAGSDVTSGKRFILVGFLHLSELLTKPTHRDEDMEMEFAQLQPPIPAPLSVFHPSEHVVKSTGQQAPKSLGAAFKCTFN